MILYNFTPDIEGNLKGMESDENINKYQYGIELKKLILCVCHLQDDDKQDLMSVVETDKQVYLLYKETYQSNTDYREAVKEHI